MFGKRILILAPHPDDEVVAACASIGRAQAQGAQIFVHFLTHGCIAKETLWPWQRKNYAKLVSRRRAEAEETARFLNIEITGFQDRPARHLWQELDQAYQEIKNTIAKHAIDQLWIPAYEGGNADHDGLNALCQKFSGKMNVLEFAEYNFTAHQTNAQTFPASKGTETLFSLSKEEQIKKKKALEIYASEKNNLGYVGLTQECFRPLNAYDYSKPPHDGTLWYARFQWVPFAHPRVDFTKPQAVCDALLLFAQTSDLPESAKQ